tara:strand:- start:1356 stop:1559 length:204 start_codon:yes stop_codon:yes gene_type:complete
MSIFLLLSIAFAEPECDLAKKMKALEIFLQDQEDHEKFCPKLDWQQPAIEVYQEKLESQLPKECKKG